MANRTLEERLEALKKRQAQLKAQEKEVEGRLTEKARKARTKRLIEVGALVESKCCEITDLNAFAKYLDQYGYAIKRTQPTKNDKE